MLASLPDLNRLTYRNTQWDNNDTRRYKTIQDDTRQYKTIQDNTGRYKTIQDDTNARLMYNILFTGN